MNILSRKMSNGSATANGSVHSSRCILVTGGAGYIGSHTALQLLLEGYKVVVIDNLDNSDEESLRRVHELAGSYGRNLHFSKGVEFWAVNTDAQALLQSATTHRVQIGETLTRGLGCDCASRSSSKHSDHHYLIRGPTESAVVLSHLTKRYYLMIVLVRKSSGKMSIKREDTRGFFTFWGQLAQKLHCWTFPGQSF